MSGLVKFRGAVKEYEHALGNGVKGKTILIELPLENGQAFFSLAPLSLAAHNMGADVTVFAGTSHSKALRVLGDFWEIYMEWKQRAKNPRTKALGEFFLAVKKRTKKRELERIAKPPEIMLKAQRGGFGGDAALCYHAEWFRWRQRKGLFATCRKILRSGYALRKGEHFSVGFELVPADLGRKLPLEDYLDNFAIARAMVVCAVGKCRGVSAGAGTNRESKLMPMVRVDDLLATIKGCEYEKKINEPVFKKFRRLSGFIRSGRLKTSDAAFGIHGEGYGGRHFFGTAVGYPTPNRKARWQGPGMMLMKLPWHTQTFEDKRKPLTRYAITETLPIENFVRTCNVNYRKMRERNAQIAKVVGKCEKLFVAGRKVKGGRTELEVGLRKPDGSRIEAIGSDSDVRRKIDRKASKKLGALVGMYDNFPGGEAFLTPYEISGRAIGDVVINIDQSHVIPKNQPIVMEFNKGKYRVVRAQKKIMDRMRKEWRDSRKLLAVYEKHKSLSKREIKCYRRNFWGVGEFAINTNPKAKLSRYLIENEKIARMIHIALGSGFDSGKETMYHWDVVINSPKQKLDIYGVDARNREHWIIRRGKFVV